MTTQGKHLDPIVEDSRDQRETGMFSDSQIADEKVHLVAPSGEKNYHNLLKVETMSVHSVAMTNKELEIVRAEMAKNEFEFGGKEKFISWMVLMTLLLAQISN